MSSISLQLRSKMEAKGISAHALEKRAGLKQSAVQNILYGRSKNPSIQIIQSIAHALECSIADLIGEEEFATDSQKIQHASVSKTKAAPWNCILYVDCLEIVCRILKKNKTLTLNKELILDYVDEIYLYSLKSKVGSVDKNFAEWLIERKDLR